MPLPDVVAFADRAFADLVSAVEGVAEDDVARDDAQSWTNGASLLEIVPGQCYAHYAQHLADVRSFAARNL